MVVINKKTFEFVIDELKAASDYQDRLNDFFRKNKVEGYIFQPDCSTALLTLLHEIFGEADSSNMIEYFCYEIDFGRKWTEESVRDANGRSIDISDAGKLYEYLIRGTGDECQNMD